MVLLTQREDFTGVAVPFCDRWPYGDTLPMFRAMDAALAQEVGSHGRADWVDAVPDRRAAG